MEWGDEWGELWGDAVAEIETHEEDAIARLVYQFKDADNLHLLVGKHSGMYKLTCNLVADTTVSRDLFDIPDLCIETNKRRKKGV